MEQTILGLQAQLRGRRRGLIAGGLLMGGGSVGVPNVHEAGHSCRGARELTEYIGKPLIPPTASAVNVIHAPCGELSLGWHQRNHVVISKQTWVGI